MDQSPNLNFFRQLWLGPEVSLKPAGHWLTLAQNSPHTTEAHHGVACSEPPHNYTSTLKMP